MGHMMLHIYPSNVVTKYVNDHGVYANISITSCTIYATDVHHQETQSFVVNSICMNNSNHMFIYIYIYIGDNIFIYIYIGDNNSNYM